MSVIETLSKARGLLETKGWVQGTYRDSNGFCLVGAIQEVKDSFYPTGIYPHLLQSVLDTGYEIDYSIHDDVPLFDWNDEPNRTMEEVLELIDTTIARLESEG